MVDLSVRVGSLELQNPIMPASGTFAPELAQVIDLGAMVVRANARIADTGAAAARTVINRRMLMAIYRGFCVMNCWSPLNVMTAVVSTAVPAAPMHLLRPVALDAQRRLVPAQRVLRGELVVLRELARREHPEDARPGL